MVASNGLMGTVGAFANGSLELGELAPPAS